jgi:hypothetical protein
MTHLVETCAIERASASSAGCRGRARAAAFFSPGEDQPPFFLLRPVSLAASPAPRARATKRNRRHS